MASDVCVFLDTPGINNFICRRRDDLRRLIGQRFDFYTAIHIHDELPRYADYDNNVLYISNHEIFNEIDHRKSPLPGPDMTGNLDLKILNCIREAPKYDRYIWVEYDVMCAGDVLESFTRLAEISRSADYVASYISPRRDDDTWMWWDSLRAPDALDVDLEAIATRAFMPLMAFSRDFIEAYSRQLALGWSGHYEATMPTIARHLGASTRDLAMTEPRLTSFPQFNIKRSGDLEKFVPAFIHPIKTFEDQDRAIERIKGWTV